VRTTDFLLHRPSMELRTTDSIQELRATSCQSVKIKNVSWLDEPEKYSVIYRMLIEEERPLKARLPLSALTKLLWHCWQLEDWFPKQADE